MADGPDSPPARPAGTWTPGAAFRPHRVLMAVLRGATPAHLHLRERLVRLIGVVVLIDAVCSVLAWWLEKDAQGSDIHTYGTALFWTTSQLLTVSSSMSNPVTGPGMWLDIGLQLCGITIVAALAASFGGFLFRRSLERAPLHKDAPHRDAPPEN